MRRHVLDVGRKTRTIPPAIRRALAGARHELPVSGLHRRRCDAHHVVHWVDGGATSLENLVLLCRRHHRAVHEGGFTIAQHPDGSTTFFVPTGATGGRPVLPPWDRRRTLHARDAPAPTSVHPLDPVTARLASAGIMIGARSVAVWDGTPFDVAWAIDVLSTRGVTAVVAASS